jgi:hypothetical protein
MDDIFFVMSGSKNRRSRQERNISIRRFFSCAQKTTFRWNGTQSTTKQIGKFLKKLIFRLFNFSGKSRCLISGYFFYTFC